MIGRRLQMLGALVLMLPAAAVSASEGVTLENVVSPGPNRSDEPFAEEFSMQAAVRFLDSAALTWQKQRKCFSCHSNYAFLMARPAINHDVPAHKQIREAAEYLATHPRKTHYQQTEAVMVASVLAQNDAALAAVEISTIPHGAELFLDTMPLAEPRVVLALTDDQAVHGYEQVLVQQAGLRCGVVRLVGDRLLQYRQGAIVVAPLHIIRQLTGQRLGRRHRQFVDQSP